MGGSTDTFDAPRGERDVVHTILSGNDRSVTLPECKAPRDGWQRPNRVIAALWIESIYSRAEDIEPVEALILHAPERALAQLRFDVESPCHLMNAHGPLKFFRRTSALPWR